MLGKLSSILDVVQLLRDHTVRVIFVYTSKRR